MHASCVICGDAFMPNIEVSATPCGHVFHTICVAQWFERSKTCPQCRFPCKQKLLRLYFDEGAQDSGPGNDPDTLQCLLDNAKFQVKLKEQEVRNAKEEVEKFKTINEGLRADVTARIDKEKSQATLICSLETQLRFLSGLKDKVDKANEERDRVKARLVKLQKLEMLVSGVDEEVRQRLANYSDTGNDDVRNLATHCELLLKQVGSLSEMKTTYRSQLEQRRREIRAKEDELRALRQAESRLQERVDHQASDIKRLEEQNFDLNRKLTALEAALGSPSGDVAAGALRRLLRENVTPNCLKRPVGDTEDDDSDVLEVEPKMARLEAPGSSDCDELDRSRDMFDDEEEGESKENKDRGRKAEEEKQKKATELLLQQYRLNMTTNGSPSPASPYLKVKSSSVLPPVHHKQHLLNKPPKHNIFTAYKPGMSSKPVLTAGVSSLVRRSTDGGKGYDGLGGRHTADEFPRPRPALVVRRRAPHQPNTTTKIKTGSGTATITNFFRNTFDD